MYIEQLYTNCLAEAAYWIESEGEVAVIDPIRETEPYLKKAAERGVKIKYVFETHFHADFVSGHIDLAKATGAKIIFGPKAETSYSVHNAIDGEKFQLGKLTFKVLHTPGHTPESSCYLLFDENNEEHAVFTGDTLFVGDVGRPDLLDGKMSKEELASMMYDSLNNKLKPLGDNVIVYPAHGPGSSCGKNIGKETWSTIGQQKKQNYAMLETDRAKFILAVTDGLSAPPQYFFSDATINKNGYDNIEEILKRNTIALSVEKAKQAIANGGMVLDTRPVDDFEKGFIPGAICIGLDGQFAVWVGTLINIKTQLLVVVAEGKEKEAILRLARVGYENVIGFLEGGMDAWVKAGMKTDTINSINPDQFAKEVRGGKNEEIILDVRRPGEYESGHVENANLFCLTNFSDQNNLKSLSLDQPYFIHCAGGYRSMIAASILKTQGFTNIVNVRKGWSGIKEENLPLIISEIAN